MLFTTAHTFILFACFTLAKSSRACSWRFKEIDRGGEDNHKQPNLLLVTFILSFRNEASHTILTLHRTSKCAIIFLLHMHGWDGVQVGLELSSFKEKVQVTQKLKAWGALVSYMVTKKVIYSHPLKSCKMIVTHLLVHHRQRCWW